AAHGAAAADGGLCGRRGSGALVRARALRAAGVLSLAQCSRSANKVGSAISGSTASAVATIRSIGVQRIQSRCRSRMIGSDNAGAELMEGEACRSFRYRSRAIVVTREFTLRDSA